MNDNISFPLTLPVNPCVYLHKYVFPHSLAHHIFPCVAWCVITDRVDKPVLLKSTRHPFEIWTWLTYVRSTGRVKVNRLFYSRKEIKILLKHYSCTCNNVSIVVYRNSGCIMLTCLCNMQRFSKAVKMIMFR